MISGHYAAVVSERPLARRRGRDAISVASPGLFRGTALVVATLADATSVLATPVVIDDFSAPV